MHRLAQSLYRPVTIDQQKVVLIPEVVGTVPITEQHEYVELVGATNTRPAINVRESDIEMARESYPGVQVFGLWHTLMESGAINYNHTLQVVKGSEGDGFYLCCEVGRASYSGVYEAGFFAADASFSLNDAGYIDPMLEELLLPEQEAKLAKEILGQRKAESRAAWVRFAVMLSAILLLGGLTDLALKFFYSHQYATLENKSVLLDTVKSGLNELRTTRLTEVPNDSAALRRIASLWALDNALRSKPGQSMQLKTLRFHAPNIQSDPSALFPWIKAIPNPNGSWSLSFIRGSL
ncbi:MAG: hypothetical protein KUG82_11825 [Pseudomonadales bacterium]|nr:hypothetical protein [Pseudomonadales bacterium]